MNWYKRFIFAGSLEPYTFKEITEKLKALNITEVSRNAGHVRFLNNSTGQYTDLPVKHSINPVTIKRHIIDKFGIPLQKVWNALPKKPKKKDVARIQHLLPWHEEVDPTRFNVEFGEPEQEPSPDAPWVIEKKQREEAALKQMEEARLKREEEERWLEEEIAKEELAKLKPTFGSDNMNWYKKANKWKNKIPGGIADDKKPSDFNKRQVEKGKKVEYEHTDNAGIAREIAIDHLEEHPKYYNELEKMEDKLEKKKPARRGKYDGGLQRVNL